MTTRNTSDGQFDIDFIDTAEELESILAGIKREVTTCIVHHTHTFRDQSLNADDINEQFKAEGYQIPYHFVILQDGSLQRGLPIDTIGQHAGEDHNEFSIAIAFVGGLNLFSTAQDRYGGYERIIEDPRYNTSDSFQANQWKTFEKFCGVLLTTIPHIQIYGHKDIRSANVLDPGFNVQRYVKQKFEKQLIVDPNSPTPTLDQLLVEAGV